MNDEVKVSESVSNILEAGTDKNEPQKRTKTGVYILSAIICIIIVTIITVIGIKMHNKKISNESYHLARNGELEESLNVADKILFNEKEKIESKRMTVLSSYLFDCKRAMKEYDSKVFDKWFGDGGEFFIYDCKFYQVPPQDGYYDYPYCILSYDDYYLLFYYDSEKNHYVACNEVKGLEQDLTPDKEFTLDTDEKWSEIWKYNENKEIQNKIRDMINVIINHGIEIETSNIMWSYVKYEDAYKTAPLLEGYSEYNF